MMIVMTITVKSMIIDSCSGIIVQDKNATITQERVKHMSLYSQSQAIMELDSFKHRNPKWES